jgi:hypothetical protein
VLRTKPDVDLSKDRLIDTWETTRDALAPRLASARDAVTPYVDTAATRLAPVLDEARTKLRSDVVPAVVAAAGTAREQSAPIRQEALDRAGAAYLALRGEKPTKTRRWPLALVCLLGGAAAGAAVAIMRRPAPVPAAAQFPPRPAGGEDAAAAAGVGTARGSAHNAS